MKRFSALLLLLLSFTACKQESSKTKDVNIPVEKSERPVSEFESDEWRKKDSVAMEYIYIANEYESRGKYQQALVLYKHVCSMDHALPDVFMNTAFLFVKNGDKNSAKAYLRKEIQRGKYFIGKKHPRTDSFEISIIQSFYYLGEEDSLNYYARKYGQNPGERYEISGSEEMIVR